MVSSRTRRGDRLGDEGSGVKTKVQAKATVPGKKPGEVWRRGQQTKNGLYVINRRK